MADTPTAPLTHPTHTHNHTHTRTAIESQLDSLHEKYERPTQQLAEIFIHFRGHKNVTKIN